MYRSYDDGRVNVDQRSIQPKLGKLRVNENIKKEMRKIILVYSRIILNVNDKYRGKKNLSQSDSFYIHSLFSSFSGG